MNFQQLRSVREAARRGYNLTEVANALFTSQPGVSKQIRALAMIRRYERRRDEVAVCESLKIPRHMMRLLANRRQIAQRIITILRPFTRD